MIKKHHLYKHGACVKHLRLYKVWKGIARRCYNKNDSRYHDYGGRGIWMCDEWKNPLVFVEWALANGWKDGLEIDRIDNNGNYSPSNCHFVTSIVNMNNRRQYKKKSTLPTGVYPQRNRFGAYHRHKYLGCFSDPETAHQAFLKAKEAYIKELAVLSPD